MKGYLYGFNGTQEQLLRALRHVVNRESASTKSVKDAAAFEIERLEREREILRQEACLWRNEAIALGHVGWLNRGQVAEAETNDE